jgi:hypothetical protein
VLFPVSGELRAGQGRAAGSPVGAIVGSAPGVERSGVGRRTGWGLAPRLSGCPLGHRRPGRVSHPRVGGPGGAAARFALRVRRAVVGARRGASGIGPTRARSRSRRWGSSSLLGPLSLAPRLRAEGRPGRRRCGRRWKGPSLAWVVGGRLEGGAGTLPTVGFSALPGPPTRGTPWVGVTGSGRAEAPARPGEANDYPRSPCRRALREEAGRSRSRNHRAPPREGGRALIGRG